MNKQTVTIYRLDDWIAMYVDGKLAIQQHSLRPEEVLDLLGVKYTSTYVPEPDATEMQRIGFSFPDDIRELYTWNVSVK
jgi:hypothetical protein